MDEDIFLQKHQLGELKLIECSRELIHRSDELLAQVIVGEVVGARLNLELIEQSRELIKQGDELLAQVIIGQRQPDEREQMLRERLAAERAYADGE
jgi:hypothetical protein